MEVTNYWRMRAPLFNSIDWVHGDYLTELTGIINSMAGELILDLGCATGVLTRRIEEGGALVYGIDISPEMIAEASTQSIVGDLHHMPFHDSVFDKLTARLTFHHITTGMSQVMMECRRVLRCGGQLIISEGVPPDGMREWFTRMFSLKEDRITLMEADIMGMLERWGFHISAIYNHIIPSCSIRNWLDGGNVKASSYRAIWKMHMDLPPEGKAAYNMIVGSDDILIDMKFVTLIGIKVGEGSRVSVDRV